VVPDYQVFGCQASQLRGTPRPEPASVPPDRRAAFRGGAAQGRLGAIPQSRQATGRPLLQGREQNQRCQEPLLVVQEKCGIRVTLLLTCLFSQVSPISDPCHFNHLMETQNSCDDFPSPDSALARQIVCSPTSSPTIFFREPSTRATASEDDSMVAGHPARVTGLASFRLLSTATSDRWLRLGKTVLQQDQARSARVGFVSDWIEPDWRRPIGFVWSRPRSGRWVRLGKPSQLSDIIHKSRDHYSSVSFSWSSSRPRLRRPTRPSNFHVSPSFTRR
jgi:hypothetical protein